MQEKINKTDVTPRLISDSIEFMGIYIALMRENEDSKTIPDMLKRFNKPIFEADRISKDQLRQLAIYSIDKIYQFATELEVQDAYTVVYFKAVIASLMQSLQKNGIKIFYVLDNEMRQDRFELATMLLELNGAAVVAPYSGTKSLSFEEVEDRLRGHKASGKNIVYIEKDASVNHIEKVMHIAPEDGYIGIFRNQAPTTREISTL